MAIIELWALRKQRYHVPKGRARRKILQKLHGWERDVELRPACMRLYQPKSLCRMYIPGERTAWNVHVMLRYVIVRFCLRCSCLKAICGTMCVHSRRVTTRKHGFYGYAWHTCTLKTTLTSKTRLDAVRPLPIHAHICLSAKKTQTELQWRHVSRDNIKRE